MLLISQTHTQIRVSRGVPRAARVWCAAAVARRARASGGRVCCCVRASVCVVSYVPRRGRRDQGSSPPNQQSHPPPGPACLNAQLRRRRFHLLTWALCRHSAGSVRAAGPLWLLPSQGRGCVGFCAVLAVHQRRRPSPAPRLPSPRAGCRLRRLPRVRRRWAPCEAPERREEPNMSDAGGTLPRCRLLG
jgi:hypothetical protein